jgi:hypothetical protein
MPWIIDYPIVLDHMRELKLRSLYYNSGAFGFPNDVPTCSIGWVGPPDPTIRPEARPLTRQVPQPYEANLTRLLIRAWRELFPGRIWVMPASHWAYELDFGSRDWLPAVLEHIGIEFAPEELEHLEHLVTRLLEMLQHSDFAIAFPRRRVVCSLHHHKQIWWTVAEAEVHHALDSLVSSKETTNVQTRLTDP